MSSDGNDARGAWGLLAQRGPACSFTVPGAEELTCDTALRDGDDHRPPRRVPGEHLHRAGLDDPRAAVERDVAQDRVPQHGIGPAPGGDAPRGAGIVVAQRKAGSDGAAFASVRAPTAPSAPTDAGRPAGSATASGARRR